MCVYIQLVFTVLPYKDIDMPISNSPKVVQTKTIRNQYVSTLLLAATYN